jgi:serine/threonine-protein kinase
MKPGEIVANKYQLEIRLGFGGMGEVWSATHTGTGRVFAIKFMHAHAATSKSARQRFAREARASAKINHPSVIDVFDVGETDEGTLYLVMEMLDGVSLGDALHATPPLTVQDLIGVLVDTSHALAAAHAVGIVHRDIKPANIFLHRDRQGISSAKILDFGISKFAEGDDFATRTGTMLGSPRYMSPEQTRSAATADHRSDLWAMGVILFEALTGTWPHHGDSFTSLVIAISSTPPASIDLVAPYLPESVRSIVRACLQPLDQRINSADELADLLERALDDATLANISLPRPQHAPGDGVKSTTNGLRLRPVTTGSGNRPGTRQPLPPPVPPQPKLPVPLPPPPRAPAQTMPLPVTSLPAMPPVPQPPAPPQPSPQPPADQLTSSVALAAVATQIFEPQARAPGATTPNTAAPAAPDVAAPKSRMGLLIAALSVTLVAILIAIVATLREVDKPVASSASTALTASTAPPSVTALVTAPEPAKSAEASAAQAPSAEPAPTPSASAAPQSTSSAKAPDAKPVVTTSPKAPPPPPKGKGKVKIGDLPSGLGD